jgi:uncharacterized membrane protein
MSEKNPTSRLEAFCDGVFGIALTLLIIDIRIPATVQIANNAEFWLALRNITPSIFAFILSFCIIFITWMNHHSIFHSINKSSGSFIYANAFLLLTVVFIPFPTALLGDHLFTNHSAPSVILYDAVTVLQSLGWILLNGAALRGKLFKDEISHSTMRIANRNGYFAFVVYSILTITAFWFPQTVAAITTLTWIFWLIFGIYTLNRSTLGEPAR